MEFKQLFESGMVFREADVDRDAGIIRDATILGKHSKNGHTYSPEAMQQAVTLCNGASFYIDHPEWGDNVRKFEDLGGKIQNTRLEGNFVRGDIQVISGIPITDKVLAVAEQMPEKVGNSIRATGRVERDEADNPVVVELTKVFGVELVTEPATTNGLFESIDGGPHNKEGARMTVAKLKADHPELVEAIQAEAREDAKSALQPTIDQLTEENQSLKSEKDAREAADALAEQAKQRETVVSAKLAEADLPETLVTDLFREELMGAADEAAIDAKIAERKAIAENIAPGVKSFSKPPFGSDSGGDRTKIIEAFASRI